METLTTKRVTPRHQVNLRYLLFGIVLMLALGALGCVTEGQCDQRVRQAENRSRARIQALADENEQLKAWAHSEIDRVRKDAEKEKVQAAVESYRRAEKGLPFDTYLPLTAPSLAVRAVFWLMVIMTLGGLGICCHRFIRHGAKWTQWTSALMIPVSVYAIIRFLPAFMGLGFSFSLAHEGAAELILLVVGFTYTWLFDLYSKREGRLPLDLLGISVSVLLMIAVVETFLINAELLLGAGQTLGLRFAVCAPVGAAAFVIVKAARNAHESNIASAAASQSRVSA